MSRPRGKRVTEGKTIYATGGGQMRERNRGRDKEAIPNRQFNLLQRGVEKAFGGGGR